MEQVPFFGLFDIIVGYILLVFGSLLFFGAMFKTYQEMQMKSWAFPKWFQKYILLIKG